MNEFILICALAVPSTHFTRPRITPWVMMSDAESRFIDWFKKQNPDVEKVFVNETPHEKKLKEHGWERFPGRWGEKNIWIKRKLSGQKLIETSA